MADVESNEVPFLVLEESAEVPHVGLEVEVYSQDDPSNRIDVLPWRFDLSSLDEIGRPGGGTISLWRRDPKLQETPSILDWRNLVRVKVNHKTVGAFLIQNKETDFVGKGEASEEIWKITGEGLRTWFHDATVFPYGGLKAKSEGSRNFNFASEQGTWYKTLDWVVPYQIQKYNMDPNDLPFGTAPAEWPDAPESWWVWGTLGAGTDAPPGFNYFRYEFDVEEGTGTKPYSAFMAADDYFQVFVDSQLMLEFDDNYGASKTQRVDFDLAPGHHVFAIRVRNLGGRAGLIAALYRAGDAALETEAELLTTTGSEGWVVNAYPDPPPGWTPGEIMLTLMAEAEARGVRFPSFLTPTFDGEVDSEGAAWSRALDWEFALGMDYFDVIQRLEEIVCDLWIDPDTLELHMYAERGANRTVQSTSVQPVKFEVGRNITRAREEGNSDIKNTLMLSTTDGWRLASDALSNSLTKYGRIEGNLSTGVSAAISGDVANSIFKIRAKPMMSATYDIIDVTDARPFVDFNVGDMVLAPNSAGTVQPTRVLSISVGENAKNGQPVYAVEFGTISETRADRQERWLKSISQSTLGGTVVNSAAGGSGSSAAGSSVGVKASGPVGATGKPGPRGINWKGDWNSAIAYASLDAVYHLGSAWISKASANANHVPSSSPAWWDLLAEGSEGLSAYEVAVQAGFEGTEAEWLDSLVGPVGPQGPGITYRGAWDALEAYESADLVFFEDGYYLANTAPTPGAEPDTSPQWDVYATEPGIITTTTPDIVYGTDGAGEQFDYPISTTPDGDTVALRTAQSALEAATTADGDTGDSTSVLVNKGFLLPFRGDQVVNVTLTEAGSTALDSGKDLYFFTGSPVAAYEVVLPASTINRYKRLTLAFLAPVTALTITAGAGTTVNVVPTKALDNTVLVYEYDKTNTQWILVSQYPVGSGLTTAIKGTWDSVTAYDIDDIVMLDGDTFVSRTVNVGSDPATSPADWLLLADGVPSGGGSEGRSLMWLSGIPTWGDALPSQTGHAGKVLATDGTNASWIESSGGGGSGDGGVLLAPVLHIGKAVGAPATATGPITIVNPAGTAVGDLQVVLLASLTTTPSLPAGWTSLGTIQYSRLIARIAPDTTNPVFTGTTSHVAAMAVYRNADISSPSVNSMLTGLNYSVVDATRATRVVRFAQGTGTIVAPSGTSGWVQITAPAASASIAVGTDDPIAGYTPARAGTGTTYTHTVEIFPAGFGNGVNSEFRGTWGSAVNYRKGDQVVYGTKRYKAVRASTAETPSTNPTPQYTGPWSSSFVGYVQQYSAMKIVNPEPGVYTAAHVQHFGDGRVGFTAVKPTTTVPTWLAYADVTGSGDKTPTLNVPVDIAPGTTEIWAVWVGTTAANYAYSISPGVLVDYNSTTEPAWYTSAWSTQTGNQRIAIQLATAATLAWNKIYDLPQEIPSQTIHGGKYLSTDGVTTTWVEDRYKGLWNTLTYYDTWDTVDLGGTRYEARIPTQGTNPSAGLSLGFIAAQQDGTVAFPLGSTPTPGVPDGKTIVAGFTYTAATDFFNALTYNYTGAGLGTVRVGIARTLGTNSDEIDWLAYADDCPTTVGAHTAYLGDDFTLEIGGHYYFVVQCQSTANTRGLTSTALFTSPSVYTGMSGLVSIYSDTDGAAWSASSPFTVPKFGIAQVVSPWVPRLAVPGAALPAVGPEGEVLTVVGGVWASAPAGGGGGGSYTRTTTVITGNGNQTAALAAGWKIIAIQCSQANTRVRVYRSAAQRTADASRPFGAQPTIKDAVIYDVLCATTAIDYTNPVVEGFRPTGEANVYFNITGTSGTVTLTWQRTE